jgi:solute carrier family 35 protein C2
MLTSAGPSQSRPPDVDPSEDREGRVSPREDGPNGEEQSPHTEDTDSSDLSSIAESDGELDDDASDDGIHDDEETGLTAKQRNERRRRRKMERRRLDARIAGVRFKRSQRLLADKNVLINLLLNAGLIVFWYLFSLSISIVSSPSVI